MATPQWLPSAQNGNALPGGSPTGSAVAKIAGATQVYNAPARTRDTIATAGSVTWSADITDEWFAGWTSVTEAADMVAGNFSEAVGSGSGFAIAIHNGAYEGDINTTVLSGVHTFKIELFDSGGGVYKTKFYLDGVLKFTSTYAITRPVAFGLNIATSNASLTSIDGTGMSIGNAAPAANAGVDQSIAEGQTATLSGAASDDGLPSPPGALTYAWSKVSGPGTVTFGSATALSTTATFSARGIYVLRLSVSDSDLTSTDDITITVSAVPVKPQGPTTYDLDTSTTVRTLPTVPSIGSAGSTITDPSFSTPITRLTDSSTNSGESYGTPSGPATNAWASDDSAFILVGDEGNYQVSNFNPVSGERTIAESFVAGNEPTFSRDINKPHILWGTQQSNSLKIHARNRQTNSWYEVYDLRTDVPSLVAGGTQYLGAVYNSEAAPERLIVAFGATQDLFPYATIVEADNPSNRVTLDVATAKIKVNGGAWTQLYRHDGTASTINVGLHSTNIDRSGTWAQLLYSGTYGGAKKSAFFNMNTLRIHEYDANKWFGHSSLGDRCHVTLASGTAIPPQWEFTDLSQGGVFPVGRYLVTPPPSPGDWFVTDHNNWNNAGIDGVLRPFVTGTQATRGGLGGPVQYANLANWAALWEEIDLVATEPGRTKGVDMWYRVCHHRVGQVNASNQNVFTFRDSPRPQISHGGMWTIFTSNWDFTLGTKGSATNSSGYLINHRRDAFLVRNSRTVLSTPPPASVVTQTMDAIEVELGSADTTPPPPDVVRNSSYEFISIIRDTSGANVDLTSATLIEFIFRKPNGRIAKGTGSLLTSYSGEDAAITAAVAAHSAVHFIAPIGFLDVNGIWRRQCKLAVSGGPYWTDDIFFTVGE